MRATLLQTLPVDGGAPVLMRLVHAEPCEPPYDDELRDHSSALGPHALARPRPLAAQPLPPPRALRLVPPRGCPAEPTSEVTGGTEEDRRDLFGDVFCDPVRTPRAQLPEPGPRAAALVRALLEVLAGDRPAMQLLRWATPDVHEQIVRARRAQAGAGGGRPWAATLRRVLVSEPADGVAEVSAVVDRGTRSRALALRLEGLDGRWKVTALQLV